MSALPKLFYPDEEPDTLDLKRLERMVETGQACVECGMEYEAPDPDGRRVICTVCANTYLTNLLDTLGLHLTRRRGINAHAHAERNRRDNG